MMMMMMMIITTIFTIIIIMITICGNKLRHAVNVSNNKF